VSGVVQNEILQPVDGLDIEVVGRLVEHDDVGFAEQRLRQQDLDLGAAVGIGHEIVVLLDGNAQPLQKRLASDSASQPFSSANSASSSMRAFRPHR
jgi:hypothetical protein